MNLHHLTLFDAVATEKHISRAAGKLRISQPAVSKQLQTLELALGTPLFDRTPKGVRLTDAGELLAGYARRILSLADEAEYAVAQLRGLRRGRLTIGASTTLGAYFLPEILAKYRSAYPDIDLDLKIANTEDIQRQLQIGQVDIAVTEGFVRQPELAVRQFMSDELVPVVQPNHPLLSKPSGASLRAFCAEPMLARELGSGTREVIEDALKKRGISVKPLMTLGSTEAIKRSVAAGVGVAFVSGLSVRQELTDGRLAQVPIAGFKLERALHVVQAKDRVASAAVTAFLGLLGK